jgi:hypothetical protein
MRGSRLYWMAEGCGRLLRSRRKWRESIRQRKYHHHHRLVSLHHHYLRYLRFLRCLRQDPKRRHQELLCLYAPRRAYPADRVYLVDLLYPLPHPSKHSDTQTALEILLYAPLCDHTRPLMPLPTCPLDRSLVIHRICRALSRRNQYVDA